MQSVSRRADDTEQPTDDTVEADRRSSPSALCGVLRVRNATLAQLAVGILCGLLTFFAFRRGHAVCEYLDIGMRHVGRRPHPAAARAGFEPAAVKFLGLKVWSRIDRASSRAGHHVPAPAGGSRKVSPGHRLGARTKPPAVAPEAGDRIRGRSCIRLDRRGALLHSTTVKYELARCRESRHERLGASAPIVSNLAAASARHARSPGSLNVRRSSRTVSRTVLAQTRKSSNFQ